MIGLQTFNRDQRRYRYLTITFLIVAVFLAFSALLLVQTAPSGVAAGDAAVAADVVPAKRDISAGSALATGQPLLFVFTPVETCTIMYCLTADAVERQLAADYAGRVIVVDVPVYPHSAHVDMRIMPPPVFAGWNLYPVAPYVDWLPQAELTDHGWGLNQTQIVFVSADRERQFHFENGLDLIKLESLLAG